MPYIKPRERPFEKTSRLITGYCPSPPQLAKVLDCSAPTARKKLRCPELLTLSDLRKINNRLHIPAEEIRATILL